MNGSQDATASPTPTDVELSVVIPAWNERFNLDFLLPALAETLREIGVVHEVIVVDNASADGTADAARARGARVIQQTERGYGGALLAGFAAARGTFVVTMDADLSHRPLFLKDFWVRRDDAEMLIASRYVPGGTTHTTWYRDRLSRLLNRVYQKALSLPYEDLSSGLRMYRRELVVGLPLRARDFDVVEEVLIRIHNAGWRVVEVPFQFLPRGAGSSHVRLLKFAWAYLRTLLRMWRLRNSVEAADYDYRAFDSLIPLQRWWQRRRHQIVLAMGRHPGAVLDVGCGSSRIILDMPETVAVDVGMHKLRWLRRRHERTLCASVMALPFADEQFDSVICSEVIEHLPDVPEIMSELRRVLRRGGTLVLGTPDYATWSWVILEWIYARVLPDAYAEEHITHFTRDSLARRLLAEGFEVLECQYVFGSEMIFKARKV